MVSVGNVGNVGNVLGADGGGGQRCPRMGSVAREETWGSSPCRGISGKRNLGKKNFFWTEPRRELRAVTGRWCGGRPKP